MTGRLYNNVTSSNRLSEHYHKIARLAPSGHKIANGVAASGQQSVRRGLPQFLEPHREKPIESGDTGVRLFLHGAGGPEKQLLFKSSNKARLHDCTCKSSWSRKVGERAPYMCFHQIVLELALYLFAGRVSIEKVGCLGTA